jgi:hypothetical protein
MRMQTFKPVRKPAPRVSSSPQTQLHGVQLAYIDFR